MKQAIGFANRYYTLWSIEKTPKYVMDAYGKHWLVGYDTKYSYHKNIAFELSKVISLYPNVEIMEDLKGKTSSWVSKNEDDLCPQIMKFGKYRGMNLDDLVESDFKYVLWLCENSRNSSNGKYAMTLDKVKNHFDEIQNNANSAIETKKNAFLSLLEDGFYDFVPERNLRICNDYTIEHATLSIDNDDLAVTFKFVRGTFAEYEYDGFPYGLPLVKGKAKRIKGKLVRFEFVNDPTVEHQVIVTDVKILK